jgi:D-alanine-D-alanine ligase
MVNIPESHGRKIRVGILFGGKSAEREVSLQSAKNVLQAIDKDQFEPVLIGIAKTGAWHFNTQQKLSDDPLLSALESSNAASTSVTLLPGGQERQLISPQDRGFQETLDVVFPVLHGPMGEDGTIQGFLELANIPYVGSGVLGSAIGMDKDVMKRLLRDAGLPIADFEVVTSASLSDLHADELISKLGLPLFVKPANMGSSVGVSKATSANELIAAVAEASRFDVKVLVEKAITGDEIECAILGNSNPQASVIGRIIPHEGDFYSYEAKYIDENGAILEIPAKLSSNISEKARQTAISAFTVLGCEGMSRVDMFACKDGSIVVNEINTIPGFTKISMYPKLWEASGVSYTELITRLIHLAIERFEQRQKLEVSYRGHI